MGDGRLAKTQEIVLGFLLDNPDSSDKEIVLGTALSINSVCGRRNELIDEGIVESNGKKVNNNGRKVYQYRVIPLSRYKKRPKPNLITCPYCGGKGKVTNPQIKLTGFQGGI